MRWGTLVMVIAVVLGLAAGLRAQVTVWYSREESERRLARIREIAASSDGKIELTIIRIPAADSAGCNCSATAAGEEFHAGYPDLSDAVAPAAGSQALVPVQDPISLDPGDQSTVQIETPEPDTVERRWQKSLAEALMRLQANSPRTALKILVNLAATAPDHPHSGECYYWMGEGLLALDEPAFALWAFKRVLRAPRCDQYDDALFRAAMLLAGTGHQHQARPLLRQLLALCPESEYVPLASISLQKL